VQCSNAAAGPRTALLVASGFCRKPGFGENHPLSIPRVATVLQLCELLGWLEGRAVVESGPATREQLIAFHDAGYVDALRRADAAGRVDRETRERHGFGSLENPLFAGVFERAATAVGGSILAAELALAGHVAFHPAGGTHHGRPDRASGFCYFNDPVFAIRRLAQGGIERILYVDLDAHHGDGVQDAFLDDDRVRVVSIHEEGRWPHSGAAGDRGHGYALNLPVPAGFNDSELQFLLDEVILPSARRFEPRAVVITCGTDALHGDPLSRLALSNVALWSAVERLIDGIAHVVVLGGGGYNPWTLARCWSGLWARLIGREIPLVLPEAARLILSGLACGLLEDEAIEPAWLETLADQPRPGSVRPAVRALGEWRSALHDVA
jgi:acetoin utilization protein AcuC